MKDKDAVEWFKQTKIASADVYKDSPEVEAAKALFKQRCESNSALAKWRASVTPYNPNPVAVEAGEPLDDDDSMIVPKVFP